MSSARKISAVVASYRSGEMAAKKSDDTGRAAHPRLTKTRELEENSEGFVSLDEYLEALYGEHEESIEDTPRADRGVDELMADEVSRSTRLAGIDLFMRGRRRGR